MIYIFVVTPLQPATISESALLPLPPTSQEPNPSPPPAANVSDPPHNPDLSALLTSAVQIQGKRVLYA